MPGGAFCYCECPEGQMWDGSSCVACGTDGDSCGGANPDCCGGLYCSSGYCCLDGTYWIAGSCEDVQQCGITLDLDCNYRPPNDPSGGQSNWWTEVLCVSSTQACCYFPEKYGELNVYYPMDIESY